MLRKPILLLTYGSLSRPRCRCRSSCWCRCRRTPWRCSGRCCRGTPCWRRRAGTGSRPRHCCPRSRCSGHSGSGRARSGHCHRWTPWGHRCGRLQVKIKVKQKTKKSQVSLFSLFFILSTRLRESHYTRWLDITVLPDRAMNDSTCGTAACKRQWQRESN